MDELVPVITTMFEGQGIPTVNLRDLHGALGVGRDFSNWIKDRIAKYGFTEDQDYVKVSETETPQSGGNLARQKWRAIESSTYSGAQVSIEYHATLDMAKELAMVENSDKGRAVRRYFIEVEKKFKAGASAKIDVRDMGQLTTIALQLIEVNAELRTRVEQAEKTLEVARPKMDFYDRYADADGLYGLQNSARVLSQPPNKFIGWLTNRYLFHQGSALVPYARWVSKGYFVVKAVTVGDRARSQTFMTPLGVQYFSVKLREDAAVFQEEA